MAHMEMTMLAEFQSTPPVRGATTVEALRRTASKISIHAPREGGDSYAFNPVARLEHFNPRPP